MKDNLENNIFIPDADSVEHYRAKLADVSESKNPYFRYIDMGRLPEIYTALEIRGKLLRTSSKAILKALGKDGNNPHKVTIETLGNLLHLVNDPEGVFKSLSTSSKPDSYISILNAKANDKQIIAIIAPARNGQEYALIPTVYERNNFDKFLDNLHKEQNALYIKDKGSDLWPRLQLPPYHNSEPYIKNILTKDDVVKQINEKTINTQGEISMAKERDNEFNEADEAKQREDADINREDDYEPDMSYYNNLINDPTQEFEKAELAHQEELQQGLSPEHQKEYEAHIANEESLQSPEADEKSVDPLKQKAFWAQINQRDKICERLKDGTSVLLPNENGVVDTSPIRNHVNGTTYHGHNLIYLKEYTRAMGFESNEFVTAAQIEQSRMSDENIKIGFGEKGISLYVNQGIKQPDSDEITYQYNSHRLFNLDQINPVSKEPLQNYSNIVQQERRNATLEHLKAKHGPDAYLKPPQNTVPIDVSCNNSEPAQYIAHYLAAVSMNREFKVSKETAQEFQGKMVDAIEQKNERGHTNPFVLSNICNEASTLCKGIIKEHKAMEIEQTKKLDKENQQEKQQEREQTKNNDRSR